MSRSSISRAHWATGVAASTTTGYGVMSCLTVTAIASMSAYPAEPQRISAVGALPGEVDDLAALLGETLLRQEGPSCSSSSTASGARSATDREATAALLAELDPAIAARLVRAFTTYFHLANVAEQVHRGRELHAIARPSDGTWLSQAVDRIARRRRLAPASCAADIRAPRGAPGLHRASDRGRAAHAC